MADRATLARAKRALTLREPIRRVGLSLGFDAIGFGPATPSKRTRFLGDWISRGYAGEMEYLERRLEERIDPRRVLPEARSLIVVGFLLPESEPISVLDSSGSATGRVARYAGGDDYHDVLLDRLRALEAAIAVLAQRPLASRAYVDTGPVSERAAASAAGLGWIGKNSCLIHPELGSHLMLGVLLSELELEPDEQVTDHCGTCRACLDICPTEAFAEPYVLDATRCISYTTIEAREGIPEALRQAHGDHVFGCDLCQTVCPWNRSRPKVPPADPLGLRTRLAKREEWEHPTLAWLLGLSPETFLEATRGTAIRRTGWRGLMRNSLVAAGNSGSPDLRPAIERFLSLGDPLLEEHARWALGRLPSEAES